MFSATPGTAIPLIPGRRVTRSTAKAARAQDIPTTPTTVTKKRLFATTPQTPKEAIKTLDIQADEINHKLYFAKTNAFKLSLLSSLPIDVSDFLAAKGI
jgi:hypothetical protein